ncbi:hypothetical protein DSL72_001713 [Monilinia vaccinii-corymbosi]|uniref:Uncharacterized protein n=1 Tax=Monilinia vaccinii-corymbosi TaxID=61207 RepID=A0A8A3P2T1_9HELO|nr:hypothetical protein DSL72_001713 [Monilinia vaccinii-corymbosi]
MSGFALFDLIKGNPIVDHSTSHSSDMKLSHFTAKALEKVEMNSFILYATGYFTQEEWVKFDAILHKGKYTFTEGPPISPLTPPTSLDVEEPLIKLVGSSEDKLEVASVSDKSIGATMGNNADENGVMDTEINLRDSQQDESLICSRQEEGSKGSASSVTEDIFTADETIASANLDDSVSIKHEQKPEESDRSIDGLSKGTFGNEQPTRFPAGASQTPIKLPSEFKEESTERSATPHTPISVTENKIAPQIVEISRKEEKRRIRLFTAEFGYLPKMRSEYYQPNNPLFDPSWLKKPLAVSDALRSRPVPLSNSYPSASARPVLPKNGFAEGTSKKSNSGRSTPKKSGRFSMDEFEVKCTAQWEDDSDDDGPSSSISRSRSPALANIDQQSVTECTESDSTVSSQKNGQLRDVIGQEWLTDTMVENKEFIITKKSAKKSKNDSLNSKENISRLTPEPKLPKNIRTLSKKLQGISETKTEIC